MNPILSLITALLLPPLVAAHAADSSKPAAKPNIIFILADDLGIGNVSCHSADNYKTPSIDAPAKLNPAGRILDDGDGTGRHANKKKK